LFCYSFVSPFVFFLHLFFHSSLRFSPHFPPSILSTPRSPLIRIPPRSTLTSGPYPFYPFPCLRPAHTLFALPDSDRELMSRFRTVPHRHLERHQLRGGRGALPRGFWCVEALSLFPSDTDEEVSCLPLCGRFTES
jgi:hypothetical protein